MKRALACLLLASTPAIAQVAETRTTIAGSADLKEQSSAPAARTNHGRLYTKVSDSGLYFKADDGTETNLLTGGASAAAILAALITVDGAGSLLDADFLDGVSGDGYCLVDGTRAFTGDISFEGSIADAFETTFVITNPTADRLITFKDGAGTVAFTSDITNMSAADILASLVTVDGAGSLLDADLLDGSSSAAFCTVAGCTMTGATTYSGVTNDIAAPSGESVTITSSSGTAIGRRAEVTPDASIDRVRLFLHPTPGSTSSHGLVLDGNTSAGASIETTNATGGSIYFTGYTGIRIGAKTDLASNAEAVTFSDTNQAVVLARVFGGGAFGIVLQQAITIADDGAGTSPTDTTSPTSSQVEVTCNDANGCVYSPGETSVVDGWQIGVCNISAANVVTLTESAGTIRVQGAATTMVLNTMECADCVYTGTEWGCS